MFKMRHTAFSLRFITFSLLLVFSVCVTSNAQGRGGAPDWTRDPYRKFDKKINIAAVGVGSSRQAAEKDALGKLVAIFGQSIQVDEKISTSYQEAVKNGAIAGWLENTSVDNTISTSAGMDSLVGAEIGDTWDNGKDYYAAAVLNRIKAVMTYSDMIRANQTMIDNLLNIPVAEKNTLNGFVRYQFAAMIADVTASYRNIITYIGAPALALGVKTGNDYRLEAQEIAKAIPVGVVVKNDKSGRIQGAFAKALSSFGFRSGGNNSRYILEVDITVSPVNLPSNPNKFARIELSANLVDTSSKTVLVPFNFNSREGHNSLPEAENRAYIAAERKIAAEYPALLNNYFLQLLPQRR